MVIAYIVQRIGPYHQARFNQVAKDLESKNHHLSVIEICHKDGEYEWEVVKGGDQYFRTVLFEKKYDAIGLFSLKKRLFNSLKFSNPDIVCIPGWSAKEAKLALLWCKLNKVKAILLSDSTAFDFKRTPIKEFVKRQIIKQFDAAFVAGTPQKDYVIKLGMNSEKIVQGYDVVDNQYFVTNRTKPYQVNGYFLAMGRFLKRKNFIRLIQAYCHYRNSVVNPKNLVLCGSGEELSNIKSIISRLRISEFVELPGFVQYHDLPKYYSGASVFIIPSTSEQWGLVINEAMASGMPIVCSQRCGAQFDLVHEGVNGFVFNPFDVAAMSKSLLQFDSLSDAEKQNYSKESLQTISKWSLNTFSESLQKLTELISL